MEIKEITPLWEHQRRAYNRAKNLDGFGFFMEVGTGKTLTTIHTMRHQYTLNKRLMKTLIIGPPIILENWKREILTHSTIPESNIVIAYGTQEERRKKLKFATQLNGAIVITNYQSLLMDDFFKEILSWNPEILVLDECHRCKSISAKQTKQAIKIAQRCKYKYLLSGSPILNSLMDIWSQFKILDNGATFGEQFGPFKLHYFIDRNSGMSKESYFPNWVPKQGAEEAINKLIKQKSIFIKKEECMDLPPFIKQKIEVELTPLQRKTYDKMLKDFVAYIEETGSAAVANLAITKALRLQQIVTGHVKTEKIDGTEDIYVFKDNPRKDALKELLRDITPAHKVLVWASFHQNYQDIREVCESLKINYVEVHGQLKNNREKFENVDKFNADPTVRVLIGNAASGGIGINLTAASHAIFYSRNFSLENEIQAEGRNFRGGSEVHEKIVRIDLVSPNTIDQQVVESLADKKKIGLSVLKEMIHG